MFDRNYPSEDTRSALSLSLSHTYTYTHTHTHTHTTYIGSVYNIPINIWLKLNHPHFPPLVYVTPTSGMAIQPSRYVDTNGLVYLPYLNEWQGVRDTHTHIHTVEPLYKDTSINGTLNNL